MPRGQIVIFQGNSPTVAMMINACKESAEVTWPLGSSLNMPNASCLNRKDSLECKKAIQMSTRQNNLTNITNDG